MSLGRTKVIRTDTDSEVGADILSKNDRRLEVALDGTHTKLTLFKDTPHQIHYVGTLHGMEFTSKGD